MITSVVNSVRDAAVYAASSTVGFVNNSATYCTKKFEDLTGAVLPHTAAKIAQKVLYGAPFAVAYLMVPAYVKLAAMAAYAMVHVVHDIAGDVGTLPFSRSTYQNLFTGVGSAHLFKAGQETLKLATQQKASIVSIAINILFASLFISKATETPAPTFGSAGKTPQASVDTAATAVVSI